MFDPDDEDFEPGDYGCKHCDTRGVECAGCDGEGCSDCDGEGVIALTDEEYDHAMYRIVEPD